ncbi:hypothetical protein K1719_041046 [Acacia pycnantha]|nr:hypothetical protein K1719_041046 [Acacia pycnantha]
MVIIMDSNKIFLLSFIPFLFSPYQSESASVSPTNTTGSQGKGGISSKTIVAVVVPISVAVLIFVVGICCLIKKRIRNKHDSILERKFASDLSNLDSLQYEFATLEAATNMFSSYNKIGHGAYGPVYKGMLPNGQEIAVKRLSRYSGLGAEQFKNEIEVLARLQHKNLVRLLGFCVQKRERIVVYEYMANGSLDYFLFDPEKKKHLDWTKRYKIVKGIAQGIQYFHEDSRLKIIHGDLNAANVLLDSDMNAKISNLCFAKILLIDEAEGNDNLITGTSGYMAPEYVMHGVYSIKSDVYNFGVLLMQTISGRKHFLSFHQMKGAEELLSYAWELWNDGKPLELLDPTIRESYTPNEVIRCIHIGLLCIQENPADRPSISSVLLMLECYPMTLPTPSQPGFYIDRRTDSTQMSVNEMSCPNGDLTAANVLLDIDMNAKISNLCFAKILLIDEAEGNDNLITGTCGYMTPENIKHGVYSIKSDVYNFGVLLMQTISGRKHFLSFHQMKGAKELLSYCGRAILIQAWELCNDGKPLELLDPTIRESYTPNEVIRCIHIGLLCIQGNPADRPSISSVLLMLECYPMTLPTPLQPDFTSTGADSTQMSLNEMSVSEEMGREA